MSVSTIKEKTTAARFRREPLRGRADGGKESLCPKHVNHAPSVHLAMHNRYCGPVRPIGKRAEQPEGVHVRKSRPLLQLQVPAADIDPPNFQHDEPLSIDTNIDVFFCCFAIRFPHCP